jgi:hypothetical protein
MVSIGNLETGASTAKERGSCPSFKEDVSEWHILVYEWKRKHGGKFFI